jgi:PAS domain S-box-containing protein
VQNKPFKFIFVAKPMETITGYTSEELLSFDYSRMMDLVHPEDRESFHERFVKRFSGESLSPTYECRIIHKSGALRWIVLYNTLFTYKGLPAVHATFWDITERKQMEEERKKLISELQFALSEVKTLSGLLPICSICKNIRDDKGYWNKLEAYMHQHANVRFSHGICPDCAKKHYPEIDFTAD